MQGRLAFLHTNQFVVRVKFNFIRKVFWSLSASERVNSRHENRDGADSAKIAAGILPISASSLAPFLAGPSGVGVRRPIIVKRGYPEYLPTSPMLGQNLMQTRLQPLSLKINKNEHSFSIV